MKMFKNIFTSSFIRVGVGVGDDYAASESHKSN
jgi:hypothetical protein